MSRQLAQKHKEVAAKLWDVRESYLSLITDLLAGDVSTTDARSRRDELQEELAAVYETAPRTLDAAYREAGIALKQREEPTFSDQEIDRLLPAPLRSNPPVLPPGTDQP
jgi:hypothetical protein